MAAQVMLRDMYKVSKIMHPWDPRAAEGADQQPSEAAASQPEDIPAELAAAAATAEQSDAASSLQAGWAACRAEISAHSSADQAADPREASTLLQQAAASKTAEGSVGRATKPPVSGASPALQQPGAQSVEDITAAEVEVTSESEASTGHMEPLAGLIPSTAGAEPGAPAREALTEQRKHDDEPSMGFQPTPEHAPHRTDGPVQQQAQPAQPPRLVFGSLTECLSSFTRQRSAFRAAPLQMRCASQLACSLTPKHLSSHVLMHALLARAGLFIACWMLSSRLESQLDGCLSHSGLPGKRSRIMQWHATGLLRDTLALALQIVGRGGGGFASSSIRDAICKHRECIRFHPWQSLW